MTKAIVHTQRADLVPLVQGALDAANLGPGSRPKDLSQCVEFLIKNPDAVLIVDWQLGSETVNQVLAAIRGHFKVETRPILLVIDEIGESVIATATEYGVSQIHAGAATPETMSECVKALITEDAGTRTIREGLVKVATAREKGDWSIATPILQELWSLHQGNDRIAVELAENLIYEEQWDQATALLQPFTETEPPHIRALHLMGRCRLRQGDYDGAIKLLERAKIINPHNVDRLIDLGHALLGNDEIDLAMTHFNQALSLDEDSKEAKVGKGQCLLLGGEVNEALALIKSISGPRELASIFNTAAILAIRQNRHEQAMQLYKSALQAVGRNDKVMARLFYNMGLGYKRWQKPEKAAACFDKSIELDPTYVKAVQQKERFAKGPKATGSGITEETIGSHVDVDETTKPGASSDEDFEADPIHDDK